MNPCARQIEELAVGGDSGRHAVLGSAIDLDGDGGQPIASVVFNNFGHRFAARGEEPLRVGYVDHAEVFGIKQAVGEPPRLRRFPHSLLVAKTSAWLSSAFLRT